MPESRWVSVQSADDELALPLLCDSPHSGTDYPEDFGYSLTHWALRSGEDTHIDTLWDHVPQVGGTLVSALFPRTYIDPNRPLDALDPDMVEGPWPGPCVASQKTRLGIGLVWRQVGEGQPIYSRKLSIEEVRRRIDTCWRPYHAALQWAAKTAWERFGCYWHLNLHSMPSTAYERLGIQSPTPLADFVLGDLHGVSCGPEFLDVVKRAIEARGYRVAVNDPYAGVQLLREMGSPPQGRHSLQVEMNRALYMDERTREPGVNFQHIRKDMAGVLEEVARYIRSQSAMRTPRDPAVAPVGSA